MSWGAIGGREGVGVFWMPGRGFPHVAAPDSRFLNLLWIHNLLILG